MNAFQPMSIGPVSLRNRVIRSATHEGMAEKDGCPTKKLRELYLRLAKGGVGAIITGYAGVEQNGKCPLHHMLMIDQDRFIGPYHAITEGVHGVDAPIFLQIAHSGRETRSRITGMPTVAPSAIRDKFYSEDMPKELTGGEIEGIIESFVKAIGRARRAGFDGVQLHAAHGYLLSQFLSPYTNRRTDQWGGTTENRFRIVREIFDRARRAVGDYPILAKLNAYDGRKGGMRIDEAVRTARLLEESGCAAIEVSCGTSEDGLYMTRGPKLPIDAVFVHTFKFKSLPSWQKSLMRPFASLLTRQPKPLAKYNVEAAQAIKAQVGIPVIVVGGITSLADIEGILGEGKADAVSMSRPFIIEPNIVKKLQEGKQERSKCIQCNFCVIAAETKPLKCYYGKLKE